MNMQAVATSGATRLDSLSLKEELTLRGIKTLDVNVVRKHKQDTVVDSRIGVFKTLGPLVALLTRGLAFVLKHPFITGAATGATTLFAAFLMFVGPFFGISAGAGLLLLGVLFGVGVVIVLHTWLIYLAENNRFQSGLAWNYFNASGIWERTRIVIEHPYSFYKMTPLRFFFMIPEELHTYVHVAGSIPGAKIHVESFGIDPLLAVTRRHGLRTETHYIGAWDTGVPELDIAP